MRVDKPFYYTQSFSMLASKSVSGESCVCVVFLIGRESESGDSFIAVSLTLDKVVNTEDAFASAEVFSSLHVISQLLIAPEGMYNQIGYYDGDDHIVCCDEKAIRDGKCSTPGTLILHRVKDERFSYRNVSFTWCQRRSLMASGKKMLLNSRYNVKRDGQYYVVVAFCNPATKNAVLAGQTAALNPHGHLPAGVFGLLDFMRALTAVYTVLMLVWTAKCCQYRRELMSIHVLISAALLLLALDALAHWAALAAYNADGAAARVGIVAPAEFMHVIHADFSQMRMSAGPQAVKIIFDLCPPEKTSLQPAIDLTRAFMQAHRLKPVCEGYTRQYAWFVDPDGQMRHYSELIVPVTAE